MHVDENVRHVCERGRPAFDEDGAVGRELRMIELKHEANELAKALGEPERYDLSFAEKADDIQGRSNDKE